MSAGRPLALLAFLLSAEAWMEEATCRVEHADPTIFILDQGHKATEAQSYCARCPHRKECLEYGKRTKSVGIWGGEILEQSNIDAVELRPLQLLTHDRPIEHLVNPPEVKDYQNPLSLFDN
jgi:hypothetical protein